MKHLNIPTANPRAKEIKVKWSGGVEQSYDNKAIRLDEGAGCSLRFV